MTAARRLVSDYPLDRLAQRDAAPPASADARKIAPGIPALRKTPEGLAGVGGVQVQAGETSVLGNEVVGGQDHPGADVFAEEPARLRWLGKLICLLTATSTGAMIIWSLVGWLM